MYLKTYLYLAAGSYVQRKIQVKVCLQSLSKGEAKESEYLALPQLQKDKSLIETQKLIQEVLLICFWSQSHCA